MVQTLDRDARVTSPVLEEVFAGAARRLRARLATRVGSDTPVRVTDVRVTMLQELLEGAEYADGALWVTFTTEGHDEPCVVAMEGRLVARLIGRMLGDAATDLEDYTPRTVTEVELAIGSRICREFLDAVEQCWTMSVPPRFRYVQAAPSRRVCADLDGELSMSVTVVDVAYAGSVLGSIFVALPMQLVRRLIPRAAAVIPGASGRGDAAQSNRPAQFDRVMPVEVDVVVELARLNVPLRQLQALRPGDEVAIGTVAEAVARVGDQPIFSGEPGSSGPIRSIRVTSRAISSLSSPEDDR